MDPGRQSLPQISGFRADDAFSQAAERTVKARLGRAKGTLHPFGECPAGRWSNDELGRGTSP